MFEDAAGHKKVFFNELHMLIFKDMPIKEHNYWD